MDKSIKRRSLSTYVGRALSLSFGVGTLIALVLMFISGGMLAIQEAGTNVLRLGPFVFFRSVKEVSESGGTTVQITPGFGVFVLLIIVPLAAGVLTYFLKRKSCGTSG